MAAFALPIIGGLSSLFGGLIGSNAAENAASQEQKQFQQSSQELQDLAKAQNQENLGRLSPLYNIGAGAGGQAVQSLRALLGTPGQGLLQGYGSFSAPTLQQAQQTPGYQFTLQQGENALQNSAAARGDLLSGNTLKAITDYGQNLANTTYNDVYNRALNSYQTNAGNFYQNQANQYGRLMGLGGMGLQTGLNAAGQLGANSQNFFGNMSNALGMANEGAMAGAAGTMGAANAWQNALGGMSNNLQFYSMMNSLNNGSGGAAAGGNVMSPASIPWFGSQASSSPLIPPSGPGFYGQVPNGSSYSYGQ